MSQINLDNLREVDEFKAILSLYDQAKIYLEAFTWCIKVKKGWYAMGIYEKIGLFLFNIEPKDESVDDFIWVILGDSPSVYLDKSILTPNKALDTYCDLMLEWADNVINENPLGDSYPIDAEPTIENAKSLKSRVTFIRQNLIAQS